MELPSLLRLSNPLTATMAAASYSSLSALGLVPDVNNAVDGLFVTWKCSVLDEKVQMSDSAVTEQGIVNTGEIALQKLSSRSNVQFVRRIVECRRLKRDTLYAWPRRRRATTVAEGGGVKTKGAFRPGPANRFCLADLSWTRECPMIGSRVGGTDWVTARNSPAVNIRGTVTSILRCNILWKHR